MCVCVCVCDFVCLCETSFCVRDVVVVLCARLNCVCDFALLCATSYFCFVVARCLNTSIDFVLYDVVVRDFLKYNDVCLVCFVLFVFVCAYAL